MHKHNNSSSKTLKKIRLARNLSIAILYVFLCLVVVRNEILHIESQLDVEQQHFVNQVETFEASSYKSLIASRHLSINHLRLIQNKNTTLLSV